MQSSKKNVRTINILSLCLLMFSPLFSNSLYVEIPDTCELKIQTPSLSCRKTAKVLLPNGLSLYLISDPEADSSGAAITVARGSWSDPTEYPGMAHLVEHLLFMGTKAYPGENDFMSYVADRGGKTNAYTAPDHTAYVFTSNHESFEAVLDRFAHFFIDPLLNPDSIKRELHNVDQEHAKNKENDMWRKYMIFKEMGNPKHPNRNFSTGNSDTLSIIPIETLRKWVENNYSANLMYGVVYSSLPLDELKEKTATLFSSVPNRKLVNRPIEENLFSPQQKGNIIHVKPIRDIQLLSLEWEIPGELLPDDTKSAKLISYALRRGSEYSLTETLKKEGLIQSLDVSVDRFGKKNILFSIQLELTAKGVQEKNKVIERCFQAIKMLKTKGIPIYLYEEMTEMAKRNYEFQTREDPFYFLMAQIDPLHDEHLSSFPQKTLLPTSFDPEKVQS
ncbi:MAG TPA: insulinase family protein, partial [Chlamydiales bacterium]|nr:insulinase family protein [Chlamydiales bacterium]